MSKSDDIFTIEQIIKNESRKKEILDSINRIERETFRSAPQPPIRKTAEKKQYPPVTLTAGMLRRKKIIPIPISIAACLLQIFVYSHILVLMSGYRSIGQFIHFYSVGITVLATLFIYAIAIGFSFLVWFIFGLSLRGKYYRAVRNSENYKQQCLLIDEENRLAQQKLDEQYAQEMNYYNQTVLPKYNSEKNDWLLSKNKRLNSLRSELQSTKTEISRLYSKVSVIPPVLRTPELLLQILNVLKNSDMTLEQVIAYAENMARGKYQEYSRESYRKSSGEKYSETQSVKREKDYFDGCNTWKDVQTRFRDLAKQYHSDIGGSDEIMKIINSQYDDQKVKHGKKRAKRRI